MVRKRKEKSATKVLKESAKDFCENTSVHGFSFWVSPGKAYYPDKGLQPFNAETRARAIRKLNLELIPFHIFTQ